MDNEPAGSAWSLTRAVVGSLLACALGCGGEAVSGGEGGAGSVTQFEYEQWGDAVYPQWFVLVVDDAPTDAARNLRQRLAEDLRGYFDDEDDAYCVASGDPGVYRPIDWQLIIVGASGTLEPRFRAEEGLHPVGNDASPGLLAAFEEAGGQAILSMETAEVLPALAEAELVHFVNLLGGATQPRSPSEAELLDSINPDAFPWAALALTRPDVSPEHPAIAGTEPTWHVLLLEWPEDGRCSNSDDGWLDLPDLAPHEVIRTTGECYEQSWLFDPQGVADCFPECMPRTPAIDSEGQVLCRVYGEFPADVDCEQQPGWTFLESTLSTIIGAPDWPVNLCELRQAEGEALEACIHDFACEGCEPSFCFRRPFTAADEGDPAHQRPANAADSGYCESVADLPSWERLRIVEGADQVDGFIRVVCQQ